MDELIRLLHEGGYSCVIRKEEIRTFTQRGVADLYDLLNQHPVFLHGAQVADKVVGKAAAALMVLGGVREVWFLSCFKCADDAVRSESKRFAYNLN